MLDVAFGLPLHPLIVHATVVVVPLATLAVLLAGLWPRFRDWAGWLPLVLAAAAVVLTPLSTQSGESLQRRVPSTELVREHVALGDSLTPWVLLLGVAAVATTVVWRRERVLAHGAATDPLGRLGDHVSGWTGTGALPRWLVVVTAVLAVVAGVGTAQQVVRIGHSGAQAAWSQAAATTPTRHGGGDGDGR
ncbi:DUF2231 domain-containing protein [Lapillicoccus jejuensis]|uniref:DUF2231 domain-containing protein n=1 Tax=Lapillicoccus jejuensis TaxID=402171 RepID=A0A542E6C9_9MICO|nr:DUF2231 domain-containing protein [Lapillicoccus jejuensis]TQJ10826.1 hypothetical protein FB458_3967 [Lapillicoccus jejuensis]